MLQEVWHWWVPHFSELLPVQFCHLVSGYEQSNVSVALTESQF